MVSPWMGDSKVSTADRSYTHVVATSHKGTMPKVAASRDMARLDPFVETAAGPKR